MNMSFCFVFLILLTYVEAERLDETKNGLGCLYEKYEALALAASRPSSQSVSVIQYE